MCAMATQAVEETYAPRSFGHQKFAILAQLGCHAEVVLNSVKYEPCSAEIVDNATAPITTVVSSV